MEIKIYTTPVGPWCAKLKEWLKKKKYRYQEFDIAESNCDKYRDEFLEKTGQLAVPVVEIDGKIIIGFQEVAIEEAIKKAQAKGK